MTLTHRVELKAEHVVLMDCADDDDEEDVDQNQQTLNRYLTTTNTDQLQSSRTSVVVYWQITPCRERKLIRESANGKRRSWRLK